MVILIGVEGGNHPCNKFHVVHTIKANTFVGVKIHSGNEINWHKCFSTTALLTNSIHNMPFENMHIKYD